MREIYYIVDLKAILLSMIFTIISAICVICGYNSSAVMMFLLVILLNSFTPSFVIIESEKEDEEDVM